MREFENNAVFVPDGDDHLGRAVTHGEICGELWCATRVGQPGRLYCAANNTDAQDESAPECTGARFRASLWLGIAADIRNAKRI
jgi:hypothetical protein